MTQQSLTELQTWLMPGALAAGGLLLGLLVRSMVLPRLARVAARSSWKYDDVLIEAVRGPVVVWFVLIGLRIAVIRLPLSGEVDEILGTIALVLGIFSVTWAAARFAAGLLRVAATSGGYHAVSLLANIARALVFAVGVLVVIQQLGISITPIITALGVGGLAVGLALQDTLANFFAGIRILMAGRIRPGDYILIDSGQEGFVEDISWGQTIIRQPANNHVIVPNTKLATAVIANYGMPMPAQNFIVHVGVSYDADLAQAERVALEVGREVLRSLPEGDPDFEPAVRFKEFGDSAITFFVVLRSRSYPDRWSVISEFIKRLHARYRDEGIEIPFPQRVVHLVSADGGGSDARSRLPG